MGRNKKKKRKDFSHLEDVYLELVDLTVHPMDPDVVKRQIREIFEANPTGGHFDYMFAVRDIADHEYTKRFMQSWDYGEEIKELTYKIGFQFGGTVERLGLPDRSEFPTGSSLSLPGVLERYTEALLAAGYHFHLWDTQSDELLASVFSTSNSERVKELLILAEDRLEPEFTS